MQTRGNNLFSLYRQLK